MAYRWKPSKTQRKAFAIKMQDPAEAAAYEARKEAKAEKRRAGSRFEYESAGGRYVPTQSQYQACCRLHDLPTLTSEQRDAINAVCSAYACNQTCHHDSIHIINELIRAGS